MSSWQHKMKLSMKLTCVPADAQVSKHTEAHEVQPEGLSSPDQPAGQHQQQAQHSVNGPDQLSSPFVCCPSSLPGPHKPSREPQRCDSSEP